MVTVQINAHGTQFVRVTSCLGHQAKLLFYIGQMCIFF